VAELNDTVFSKSFKAPSAWAEREVKYKMEKRDWESKVEKLRVTLRGLQAENAAYRAASKTSEMEEQIVVCNFYIILNFHLHVSFTVCFIFYCFKTYQRE
jgi:hypothetical protein